MAKATAPSLLDDVLAMATKRRPGPPTWFDNLPPDAQQEMLLVRDSFDPSRHQKRAFFRALKAAAEKRGWTIAGEKAVVDWINSR